MGNHCQPSECCCATEDIIEFKNTIFEQENVTLKNRELIHRAKQNIHLIIKLQAWSRDI